VTIVRVPFAKMHGAGNDFVVVDRRALPALADETAVAGFVRAVCDRRRGVGADGVLFLDGGGPDLDFAMRYYNRDGGEADLCGNGGRCLAAFAQARGLGHGGTLAFRSPAGRHRAQVKDGIVDLVLGDVAPPELGVRLETADGAVTAARVTVGVPHLVIEVPDVAKVDLATFAPGLRAHPALGPAGANVDVATVTGPSSARLRTFERGVEGETLACGTGAVATAAALVAAGRVRAPVRLDVASGDTLTVSFAEADTAGGGRLVGGTDLVQDLGAVGERLEAVRAPLRDVERATVVLVQPDPVPPEVRVGRRTEVEHDVEDRAADAADELRLFVRRVLEVHAAQRPRARRAGDARLGQLGRQPSGGELGGVPSACEVAALVGVALELHDDRPPDGSLHEPHRPTGVRRPASEALPRAAPRREGVGAAGGARNGGPRRAPW